MSNRKKKQGEKWEKVALQYYLDQSYLLIDQNATKRWGEIDLIMLKEGTDKSPEELVFIEVKVVDAVDDLYGYITARKLKNLEKSIAAYIRKHNLEQDFRLDVVFIKNQAVFEVFESVVVNSAY